MATDIDSLQIQINAQATKANDAIDRLVTKLDRLTTSLSRVDGSELNGLSNGIQQLGIAMQTMNNVKTTEFTRLSSNLAKLGSVNVSTLNSAAISISGLATAFNGFGTVSTNATAVGDLAKNVEKLGDKKVKTAADNIPRLATAMRSLMNELSQAPKVSQNLIDMTNALANLTAQGKKVGSASNSIVNGLNKTDTAVKKSKKSFKSLASAIGTFYANFGLAIRGVKDLIDSVESSMDYLETLNYFEAAFGQVADNADLSSFKEFGYSSAEEYYNSFSSRAKDLTSKMTGFTISENGTFEDSGLASLGINPEKVMNYQAMFGQMSSSMGVTSETALKLSNVLTMIGADLASVKNMDFEKVWNDMASGLAGMSRTLDKYGANIRNVNLQQKLTELGINANITALNQNDKALLRTIILLDSTKYAWGDLADTLEQPANQVRLLKSNFENLTRTLGSLFLPLVQKLLPYINGLVIAVQRLVAWVGNLFGLNLSEITSSIGGSSDNISDLLGGADEASDALGSAAENAKKLKNATLGIDELNINAPKDDSDGSGSAAGLGGALDDAFNNAVSEYQAAWDEAFAKMQERAQNLADKIGAIFEPVKKIFEDIAIGDWFAVGEDTSNLVTSIFDFFAKAIDNVDWYGIGKKIGDFFAGINWFDILKSVGDLIWQAIKASIEQWSGMYDAAPIETSIITGIALLKFTGAGSLIVGGIKKAILGKVGELASIFTEGGLFKNIGKVFVKIFSGEGLKKALVGVFGELGTKIIGIGTIMSGATMAVTNFFSMWRTGFNWIKEALMVVGIALAAVGTVILGAPALVAGVVAGIVAAVGTIAVVIHDNWESVASFFTETIPMFWEESIAPWFSEDRWYEIGNGILEGLKAKWGEIKSWWGGSAIVSWWKEHVEPWFTKDRWKKLFDSIKTSLKLKWDETVCDWVENIGTWWKEHVEPWFTIEKWSALLSKIPEAFKSTFKNAANGAIEIFNRLIDWINSKMQFSWDSVNILGKEVVPAGSVQLFTIPHIPSFETGGFPEDGLFYANHNELVGSFTNGKTVVANNEQIVSGIKQGVKEAVAEILTPYLSEIAQNTRETADKDLSVEIGDREIYSANLRGAKAAGRLVII